MTDSKRNKITFGTLSIALFWWIVLSGILLAVPYDVSNPYLSIGKMVLLNPWASLIRNIHYWSSQFFLILSLLHLYDHFKEKKAVKSDPGLWLRLTLGVLIIFLAMLTGFLLKGDADSNQAQLILDNLISEIPFVGKFLSLSLLGNKNSYLLIYVHHIATFTLFLAVIITEHSRKIWPSLTEWIYVSLFVVVLSIFVTAPLHDTLNGTVKGPWYFVGLQEMLHFLEHPSKIIILIFILLLLIYLIPFLHKNPSFLVRRILLVFMGIYMLLTISGFFFRGESWKFVLPWQQDYRYEVLDNLKTAPVNFFPGFETGKAAQSPVIRGQYESCIFCHGQTHGFTKAHQPETTGCFACHGGNPLATGKNAAHRGMRLIPGNLNDARQSCGTTQCHPGITERIHSGLMATLSGMISVDRYVFGENESPDLLTDIHHLKNSAADEHLKNLCVRCHLGNPKTEWGPVTESSRGGGCLACHLNYSDEALTSLKKINAKKSDTLPVHPQLSLAVSNGHCFGCHSRSGRISTGYEGWHETTLEKEEMPDTVNYRLVEGFRVFERQQDDVHHRLGMDCIDCHTSYELMGDGNHYRHEEEQQDVQCSDCHVKEKPITVTAGQLDEEPAMIAALRYGGIAGRTFLQTAKHKYPLINTFVSNDSVFLIGKNNGKKFYVKKQPAQCLRDSVHRDVSCSACHSAWAPACIGCHNAYDAEEPSYNMIANKPQKGGWVEFTGDYLARLPSLGIRKTGGKKEIIPVVHGMVLSIDKKSFTKKNHDSLLFKRLFAPAAPHTTAKKGRSCTSCHNNPVALGYGEGKLVYDIRNGTGKWTFVPEYENSPYDGLPEDAWTGFLKERSGDVSTRSNLFPFDIKTQQKILTVGACLTCHSPESKVMKQSLGGFDKVLKRVSDKCMLPVWK